MYKIPQQYLIDSSIINLSSNCGGLGVSPKITRLIKNINKKNFINYPDNQSINLRKEISKFYNLDYSNILVGNGSSEIIKMICDTFITKKNDGIIISEYAFSMYKIFGENKGAKIIRSQDINFKISIPNILKKITKKTKVIFINNPYNPTGTYLLSKEIMNLKRKLPKKIILVIDDACSEYIKNKNFKSGSNLFKNNHNVITINTFSKVFGLAGLRIGWCSSSSTIIKKLIKKKTPYNVNSIAQLLAVEALRDKDWFKKSVNFNTKWKKIFYNNLKNLNINLSQPSANFFLLNFDNLKLNSRLIYTKLLFKKILLRDMKSYKLKNSLRVNIGSEKENKKFLNTIKRLVN